MNQLAKTNKRYTYNDFLVQKKVLKEEISGMENSLSPKNLSNQLGLLGSSFTNFTKKSLGFTNSSSSNFTSLILDWIIRKGGNKIINKFIGKRQGPLKKIILMASSYFLPWAVVKVKNFISKKIQNKNKKYID
ncbi:hypothetical protein ETU08_11780 [Apibacter muscae]|uniref:Uncharacterized protein n=1 Tax=Apibacter muscae TaxID=2509004 RepID=A0A563D9D4_9FLAO|nr:hypothetical protein [Apibacter muscae]TWP26712.1 hypothetical protein ETU09_09110 [Apibacter muscae]TWP27510.1 hypothetical protein ETU08_11780 [Apibacter muscae]